LYNDTSPFSIPWWSISEWIGAMSFCQLADSSISYLNNQFGLRILTKSK
jgi:hypothetical protein